MKISYNWLNQFILLNNSVAEVGQMLTGTGLEVEDIHPYTSIPGGLKGIVIGEVISCIKHPNADKLKVCQVQLSESETKQIVCGAPNVAEGQKVLVATVGAVVHPTKGEPFEIKKAKIRGESSEGMICAEDELSLGESHDGILILPDTYEVGKPASDYFPIYADYLLEIGLTANRGDAASHLGVARDLRALTGKPICLPEGHVTAEPIENPITIEIQDQEACKRYTGLYISGVQVKDSPQWLQNLLKVIGLKPINHVVDVTNYVLHGLGQPLHAFDANQIAGNKIIVRKASASEPIVTLDGVTRKMNGIECLICDESHPLAIAGVFGGAGSGISDSTTNIYLESAYFDPVRVRKAAKGHALNTDASFRFERGTDPNMTVQAILLAAKLITEIGGGNCSAPDDVYPIQIPFAQVPFSIQRANQLIGQPLDKHRVMEILAGLDIEVMEDGGENLLLKVPPYRSDVHRQEDITEEILRIYGLNHIEIGEGYRAAITFSADETGLELQERIATWLSNQGYNEVMTNSLTKSAYYTDLDKAVRLLNPLSSELDVMRMTMHFSLLEVAQYNRNRKNNDLRLYEFGRTYHRHGSGEDLSHYAEKKILALLITGANAPESWESVQKETGFFEVKGLVERLLQLCGISAGKWTFEVEDIFEFGATYTSNKKEILQFGLLKKTLTQPFDLDSKTWLVNIDLEKLISLRKAYKFQLEPVSVFPSVRRDLALVLEEQVQFSDLQKAAFKAVPTLLTEMNVFDVFRGEKIGAGKKSYAISFTLQDKEKTLTDKEIEGVMTKLVQVYEKDFGALLRA